MSLARLQQGAVAAAAALWTGQAALAIASGAHPVATALPAVLLVGLALVPLLPRTVLATPLAGAALVLPVGALGLSLATIALSSLGVPLHAGTVLAALAAFVLAGLLAARSEQAVDPLGHTPWWAVAGLGVAVGLTLTFALVVNHHLPATGNDWAKYLLYADEIRNQHGLLIHNPYWLGGVPFREDPGAPALYGALLLLSGGQASGLAWDVVALSVLGTLSVFGAAAALYGLRAAVPAALLYAAVPATFDMTAWHGTANLFGLALLPLVLLGCGALARGQADRRDIAWLAVALVGTIAAHRLTSLIAVALVLAVAATTPLRGRAALAPLLRLGVVTAVVGALVAWDVVRRARGDGGLQPYTAYLDTKVVWDIVLRDLTRPAVALALAAMVLVVVQVVRGRAPRDPALALGALLGAITLVYAYSWIVHFPGYYIRAAYFLPLAMAFAVAAGLASSSSRGTLVAALGVAAVTTALAPHVIRDSARFYRFVDRPALRGLDYVAATTSPADVVVADRCYGFPSAWLLQRPTLAALEDADVGPAAELPKVRQARAILRGGAAGVAAARATGARYALLSPQCPTIDAGRRLPAYLVPRYASARLVVFEIRPDQLSAYAK